MSTVKRLVNLFRRNVTPQHYPSKTIVKSPRHQTVLQRHGRVDVMVCTYNSERFLDACLTSIRRNIPVETLWVVDKYSEDLTQTIARKHGARIIESDGGILEARALGFRTVETGLFVNVDSDVVLPDNWFARMMKYWEKDLGCLWGITVDQQPLHKAYVESMYRIRDPTSYNITHLPNMIARRDVLTDIHVPEGLKRISFGNDDAWIAHWMRDVKHARIKNAPIRCKHYTYPAALGTKSFWFGSGARLTRLTKFGSMLLRTALAFPQGCFAGLVSGNARVIPYWTRFRFECMIGWLNWNKYVDLKRIARSASA